jgi:cell division septation protein DedD
MAGEAHAAGDPYRRSQAEQTRRYNDHRSAHPRDLDYVEEGSDDLFEEDQNYSPQPRRRATSQEYAQAYRDYEGGYEEPEERRRTGPFLLVGALILAGVVASGLVYYYKSGTEGAKSATEGNVPVVAEPQDPVKTQPEAPAAAEDDSVPSTQQQSSVAPATDPTPGAKKQIYDRILGETTLEEQEQVVPSEEQPAEPEGNTQGFDSDPLPLPLPPSPGGSSEDQSGSLDAPSGAQTTAAVGKSAAENVSQQASPAAANPSSTEMEPSEQETQTTDATQPIEQTVEPAAPQPAAPAVTAEQKNENELGLTQQAATAGAGAAGPVQIAQLPGLATASTATPQALPDIAEGSTSKRRTIGRVTDKVILNSNRNFNKPKSVQVAQIEPQPLTTQSTTEATPPSAAQPQPAPQQQAALVAPSPQPQAAPTVTLQQKPLSGFVIQLASYKTEVDALAGYDMLRQQHASIVGNLTPNIEKTDLGGGGTFYRLHLGSFPSRQAARTACTNLLAAGERDCIVKTR